MAEITLFAKDIPNFPPLRETGLTVQSLFASGAHRWSMGAKYRDMNGKSLDVVEKLSLEHIRSFDITGAIDYCYSNAEDNQTARIRIGMLLRTTATRWNDAPGRTWEDVVELARKANI